MNGLPTYNLTLLHLLRQQAFAKMGANVLNWTYMRTYSKGTHHLANVLNRELYGATMDEEREKNTGNDNSLSYSNANAGKRNRRICR